MQQAYGKNKLQCEEKENYKQTHIPVDISLYNSIKHIPVWTIDMTFSSSFNSQYEEACDLEKSYIVLVFNMHLKLFGAEKWCFIQKLIMLRIFHM